MSRCAITAATLCVILIASGCGGGSDTKEPSGVTPDPLLSDPAQAFAASSQRLEGAAAIRAEFDWQIKRSGFDIKGNGTFVVVAPNGLHLEAHYRGQGDELDEANDSELLVLGQTGYLKTPPLGSDWYVFTPEELGADWEVLQRLISARSPLSYASVVGSLSGDIKDRGLEDVNGESYQHFQATVDAGSLMNALADAYGTQGQVMLANRFAGPVTIDIWLDPATLLPHAVEAKGTFQFEEAPTDLTLRVDYSDINGDVALPSAPTDAVPASELR